MVQYKYALDTNERTLNISEVKKEMREKGKFRCISCNKELIAKLGSINAHHFAHKSDVTCTGETYLHKTAKNLFLQTYNEFMSSGKPFVIEIPQHQKCNYHESEFQKKCDLGKQKIKFDLVKYFPQISLESRIEDYIPDILLTNSKEEKIFVEIKVKHGVDARKISSKNRIIEIHIRDEADLEIIKTGFLSEADARLKFHNFIHKQPQGDVCKGNCKCKWNFFVLYEEGNAFLQQRTLTEIRRFLSKPTKAISDFAICKDEGYGYPEVYKYFLSKFQREGKPVRNCFLCRYHALNDDPWVELPIFCKFLKEACTSTKAVTCNAYRAEPKYVNELYIHCSEAVK